MENHYRWNPHQLPVATGSARWSLVSADTSDWRWLPEVDARPESPFSYRKAALVCCCATVALCFWFPDIPQKSQEPRTRQMAQELESTDSFKAFLQNFRERTRGCDYFYSEKGNDHLESWLVTANLDPKVRPLCEARSAIVLLGEGRSLSILQFAEPVAPCFENLNQGKLLLHREFSNPVAPVPTGGYQEPHGNGLHYTPFSFEFGSGRYLSVTKGKEECLLRNQDEVKLVSDQFFLGCTSGTSFSNISSIPFDEFPASGTINLRVNWHDADFTDSFQVRMSDYKQGFRLKPSKTVRRLPARRVPATTILWCCIQALLGGLTILLLHKQRQTGSRLTSCPVEGISRPS
jgi:hypothetical protein